MSEKSAQNSASILSCRTVLLYDEPASKDAFNSHLPIANAIADIISKEKGKKAIALLGGLGSGKSTVIALLKQIFASEDKTKIQTEVFIYDAWSHVGDPLRRSFLEGFVEFVSKAFLNESNPWKKDLDALSNRTETTITTSEPILKPSGKWILGLVLFLPLGYALISGGIEKELTWLWVWGFVIILSPTLIVAYSWLRRRPHWNLSKKDFWLTTKKEYQGQDLFWDFVCKIKETIKTSSIKTPDPTSIEFQKMFTDVVTFVLDLNKVNQKQRKIVVVIDNLDRVEPEQVLPIWATMLTFFDIGNNATHQRWLEHFTLIVPFAPNFPKKVFGVNDQEGQQDNNLDQSFVEKTFQSILHVPPPILSKYKEYMLGQLRAAFPDHNDFDFYVIYRLFDLKFLKDRGLPTPRDIKVFINKIGSYNRMWGDKIHLPTQSLYVLYTKEISSFPMVALSNNNYIDERTKNLMSSFDWQKDIAALHFNISPDLALEASIGQTVKDILNTGDPSAISEKQINEQSFITIAQRIVDDSYEVWSKEDPVSLAKAALTIKPLHEKFKNEWLEIMRRLREGLNNVEAWKKLDKDIADGIVTILQSSVSVENHQVLASKVLKGISSKPAIPQATDKETSDIVVSDWLEGAIQILRYLHENKNQDLIIKDFRIPGQEYFYRKVLAELYVTKQADQLIPYFQTDLEESKVVASLIGDCANGQFKVEDANVIELMRRSNKAWPWIELTKSLDLHLDSPQSTFSSEEISGLIRGLLVLGDDKDAWNASGYLKELSIKGSVFFYLGLSVEKANESAVAYCLLAILLNNPSGTITPPSKIPLILTGQRKYNEIIAAKEDQLGIKELANFIVFFNKTTPFIENCESCNVGAHFISSVMANLLNREDSFKIVDSSLFIKKFNYFNGKIAPHILEDHCKKLIENDSLDQIIKTDKLEIDFVDLYKTIFSKISDPKKQGFILYVSSQFQAIDESAWIQHISEEDKLLDFLIFLEEGGVKLDLGHHHYESLLKHVEKILDGVSIPSIFIDRWKFVIQAMKPDLRQAFPRGVIIKINNNNEKNIKNVLSLYQSLLLDSDAIVVEFDNVFTKSFPEILKRKDPIELSFLISVFKKHRKLIEMCDANKYALFRDHLRDLINETQNDSDLKSDLVELANSLEIILPTANAPEVPEING